MTLRRFHSYTGWVAAALLSLVVTPARAQGPTANTLEAYRPAQPLPGTERLEWPEADLSQRLMDGAHRFIDRKLAQSADERARQWSYDLGSRQAYVQSIEPLRAPLKTILGVVESREPPRMERYGDERNPAMVAETDHYKIFQVRWPVYEDLFGEGLLVLQDEPSAGQIVVVPDADQTPEQLLGLAAGLIAPEQIARRMAAQRYDLLIPTILDRGPLQTDDPRIRSADYTPREWIYRQAFHMGRHLIGYEIQRVMAGVDWLDTRREERGPVGIIGYGEGGLIALHAAALDPRIAATLVSGYFDSSDSMWSEPIYRNVWSRLNGYGNAEVAALVLPRTLVVEHSPFPNVSGHKGELRTPPVDRVKAEFARIPAGDALPPVRWIAGESDQPVDRWSSAALNAFVASFDSEFQPTKAHAPLVDRRADAAARSAERQQRAMDQLESQVQKLVRRSAAVREDGFLHRVMPELADGKWSTERRHPVHQADKFIAGSRVFREKFHAQAMGRFEDPLLPFNARSRVVAETDSWTAYDVVLDVYQDLFAWGVLVVPKDIKPGEQRPVVVCQHGRNGVPRDTIDQHKTAYNDFAAKLAERGFITFAPHNLYRGEDRYRWLDRKANAVGRTLFSFILSQHDQTLRWLDTLPFVDGDRIAFYGLSYGGETAVRVPPILEKYCLSICSGDFNQWTRKVASTEEPFSFMHTIEWEMPYWNLGHTFDYAEMAYLMVPRPFMVERGHHDRVGRDHWVAHEFAKVRWLYAQLGISDRVEIEYFQGGHSINGEGSFDFLHKHLQWPKPASPQAGSMDH
ncbi:dienelactone hydrolase family protein [Candidatus Laterigemmans baculatus]|uniref:dienelactone hydrolase family protein n=1 Tax=Candidatus Laterigemmans baculatus TaxID=2770505 RepID=UPI0013D9C3CD|nr:dienelactone hydrolase family protein [Candidatus Laterigemmans baculatus]